MSKWKIGCAVWWHDSNKRRYRRDEIGRSVGRPIYSESFWRGVIVRETSRSWVVEFAGDDGTPSGAGEAGKIGKASGFGRPRAPYTGPFLTTEEMRLDVEANERSGEISSWWKHELSAHERLAIWRAHTAGTPREPVGADKEEK